MTDAGKPTDSIDRLALRLSASPLWTNGSFPKLDLSESASVDQVLARMFERISFDPGRVTTHTISKTRTVHIGAGTNEYTAVLVDTNVGRKIVLLQWQGTHMGWWTRAFDE